MIEAIILGVIQGLAEWLPISSEGLVALARVNLFGATSIVETIEYAIFLHMGTFFAALIYLWKDVKKLALAFVNSDHVDANTKIELRFLIWVTIISGGAGLAIYQAISGVENLLLSSGKAVTFVIGVSLLVTAWLQLKRKQGGTRKGYMLKQFDGVMLGLVQAFSVIPGISRSGITVSTMLFRDTESYEALRLSFLLSLPTVLGANVVLHITDLRTIQLEWIVAAIVAFVVGLATIHVLMRMARKIQFGWVALVFGVLSLVSVML